MNRVEFINQLRTKLDRLPADELKDVLEYYDEIFLEAGVDKEEETARNLGDIDFIVRQIYVENNIKPDGDPEFVMGDVYKDEKGFGNTKTKSTYNDNEKNSSGWSVFGKLMLIILTFPIWFSLLALVFAVAFSIVVTVIALGIAFGISGFAFSIVGIVTLFMSPPVGLVMLGTGFIILSIFFAITTPFVKGGFRGLRSLVNVCVSKIHNLFFRRSA